MQQAAPPPPEAPPSVGDAPPKQVAQALERLGEAGRLIADVSLGADRLLESLLFVAAEPHRQHSSKCLNLILREESLMRHHLQNLRSIGRQLEESGVLNDSLRSRSNSWGLHMPLVYPDGAVVRMLGNVNFLARLVLLPLTGPESGTKKHCSPLPMNPVEELGDQRTIPDILSHLEKENPNLKAFTYQRLDWLKRASSLPSAANESSIESSKDHGFSSTSKLRRGSVSIHATDKAAVIELLLPSVSRAIVSLV